MGIRCFLIEQTGQLRYEAVVTCPSDHRHVVAEKIGDRAAAAAGDHDAEWASVQLGWDDVDWPASCPTCGVEFDFDRDDHRRHLAGSREWARRDTGEAQWNLRDFGPGAMWNADWMPSAWRRGGDGRYLCVMLPNGHEWSIDSEASNCTRPGEDHDCWCRHGEPPNLTVDKVPEPGRSTCQAGAGSILSGDWHGFLRAGELVLA